MPSHRHPTAARCGARGPLAMVLLAAVAAAGCAGGPVASDRPASPTSIAVPPASGQASTPTVLPSMEVASTPPSRPAGEATGGPPSATLTPPGGGETPGDLGGYTWAGAGSDAPWLAPPPDRAVGATGPYEVAFDPPLPVEAWTARWAPVTGGGAGDAVGYEEGGAGPIIVAGPAGPGPWTLQVDARFAGGGRAAWYWRLEPAP